jgi:hypothetical protein
MYKLYRYCIYDVIYIIHIIYSRYIFILYAVYIFQYIYFIYILYTVYILRGVACDACGLARFKKKMKDGLPPPYYAGLHCGRKLACGLSPPFLFSFPPSGILAGLSLRCVCVCRLARLRRCVNYDFFLPPPCFLFFFSQKSFRLLCGIELAVCVGGIYYRGAVPAV